VVVVLLLVVGERERLARVKSGRRSKRKRKRKMEVNNGLRRKERRISGSNKSVDEGESGAKCR
jgi:hypothetical protein